MQISEGSTTEDIQCIQGLWEAAENILNTIVLPPAIDDAGGAGTRNYDYTQVSLRLPASRVRFQEQCAMVCIACLSLHCLLYHSQACDTLRSHTECCSAHAV